MGMIAETYLAFLENLISENTALEIINNIRKFFPYISIEDFKDDEILALMTNDKKNVSGKINFSLITGIGSCVHDYRCGEENIRKSIGFYRK